MNGYEVASFPTDNHPNDIYLSLDEDRVETWRDLCDFIREAETLLVLDAETAVHYLIMGEAAHDEDKSQWYHPDLEEEVNIPFQEPVIMRLDMPSAGFKRRYCLAYLPPPPPKRRCVVS
jgi:hypothetical protein